MLIHPALRALRDDDAPQRDAQALLYAELGAWRGTSDIAAVLADVETFAAGRALDACPALAALFDPARDAAARLAHGFAAVCAEALARAPLGHVPLRHFTDGTISTLLLERAGPVTLSLVAIDGEALRARPAPRTADFAPGETWERVLAGTARARRIACRAANADGADLKTRKIEIKPGSVLHRRGDRETVQVREVDGCLVSLRLQRRTAGAGPTREYDLADGRLVHQAAADPRDSRIELMMALLGRMERTDAAPLLAEMACEAGSAALRWQALRECLALDTQAGFAALTRLARSPGDALAPAAGALHAQLVEAHPQLAGLVPCPA